MAETESRVREVLSYLSPNCDRYTWAEVICPGIKNAVGEGGHGAWHDWSAQGEKYNFGEAEDVWRSWSPIGKRTFASVVALAKLEGYNPKGQYVPPTPEQKQASDAAAKEAAKKSAIERAAKAEKARERANGIWDDAKDRPATEAHLYVKKKGIKPHGLRIGTWTKRAKNADGSFAVDADGKPKFITIDNVLLVPILDKSRKLQSVQGITAEGEKFHLPGASKLGNFSPIEGTNPGLVLAEGWATAASINEATGRTVLCCFDAGNVLAVAKAIHESGKVKDVTIAADNDTETEAQGKGNPGMQVAFEAGRLFGMKVAVPPPGCDFNDLVVRARAEGLPPERIAAMVQKLFDDAPVPGEAYKPKLAPAAAPAAPSESGAEKRKLVPTGEGIGQPVDLFNVLPPPPLPLDCFPAPIAAYARDQAELLGCDPAIIAVSALVAAASMIHDGLQIQPKQHDYSWKESPRLWGAMVGDPSTMKTPGIAKGMRHVRKANGACAEANKASEADFLRRYEDWKESCKLDGKGVHPQPQRPPRKRRIVEDTTVEALADVLADNEGGVMCFVDELTGWFGSMDAYKGGGKSAGKDRAHWLELYNGGPRQIDRVQRGSIFVPNFSACVLGGIQPGPMRRIASGMGDDGLLQRFMVVIARPAEAGQDRAPDADAVRDFDDLFAYLEAVQPGSKPVVLAAGAHLARERVNSLALKMGKAIDHPQLKACMGKWPGLFARILLTVHVCECAARKVHPTAEPVSPATAERVEKLMCAGLLHHAMHFYTELVDADDRHEHVRQLARLILARGWSTMSRRDLATGWKASRSLKDWELQSVIGTLCTYGWLEPESEAIGHDGRPNRWAVNPLVHEAFATRATIERDRRQAAVAAIREVRESHAANDPGPRAA